MNGATRDVEQTIGRAGHAAVGGHGSVAGVVHVPPGASAAGANAGGAPFLAGGAGQGGKEASGATTGAAGDGSAWAGTGAMGAGACPGAGGTLDPTGTSGTGAGGALDPTGTSGTSVSAGAGGAAIEPEPRGSSGPLWLSEVFYDPEGLDTEREWIELYNPSSTALDLGGMAIQVATSGAYRPALALSGRMPALGCLVVGGPALGEAANNFTGEAVPYLVAADFSPDLGNATYPSDGIHLVAAEGLLLDRVVYGAPNSDGIVDDEGVPEIPTAPDAASGESIERVADGSWRVQVMPTPGDCTALRGASSGSPAY